ncbi:hypothetical protein [Flavobacterium sp. 3HN19-14]|uniref:hypothetical protein n=1 Tax=Flavobacterium sp. 3HN19-14 TaxID=3448133 RepID=UPI003EE2F8CD
MENSNENLLQGSITDNIQPMMRVHYQRTDSNDKTVITIKNDGPAKLSTIFSIREERSHGANKLCRLAKPHRSGSAITATAIPCSL